jgi:hypothetical protein
MGSFDYWLYPERSAFKKSDFRSRYFTGTWQKHFIDQFVKAVFADGYASAFAHCADYKDEHLPVQLYKFCSPSVYSLINLENGRLWLSSPEQFNDPFDSYIGIEEDAFCKMKLADEMKRSGRVTDQGSEDTLSFQEYWRIRHAYTGFRYLSAQKEQTRLWSTINELSGRKSEEFGRVIRRCAWAARMECREMLTQLRDSAFRVACFSNFTNDEELGRNTTMWSHYAAEHTGFCLKFRLDLTDVRGKNELKCGLFPVKYSGMTPKASPSSLLKATKNELGQLELNAELSRTIYKGLVTKSKFWNYEKEYRLILNKSSELITEGNIDFPFVEAVYLGCRMEKNISGHIAAWAKRQGLPVYQAKKHDGRFTLDFDLI